MSLRHGLLGLLTVSAASGYDLLKHFNSSLAFVWPATQSQLYTELNRMADDGLIEVSTTGRRNRKEYAITPTGREELHTWLRDVAPERTRRNDAMLRVFFLWTLPPQEARTFLEREANAYQSMRDQLTRLRDTLDWDQTPFDLCGRLALEAGLRTAATYRDWAEWALDRTGRPGHAQPPTRNKSARHRKT
jgi:DNA-binding PadR family transcriptional regulator